MATFTYEGIATRSIDFDPAADTLTLNLTPAEIANVSEDADGVKITTTAGFVLTLAGLTYADLVAEQDSIVLQNGGDFLFSDGSTDGTAVADVIVGTEGADALNAAGGDNLIFGGRGQADATDGIDVITAGNGNDTIYGNGGNDQITSTGGNDLVFGGLGGDIVSLNAQAGQTVTVYGGSSEASATDGNDQILVSSNGTTGIAAGNAMVFGNGGNDDIAVYANGNNTVYGGFGNDNITVSGAGNNLIVGGADDLDTIVVTGNGNNTIYGGQAEASANDLRDVITVNGNGNNVVFGNGGDDLLTVNGNGNNSIYGGLGQDELNLAGTGGVAAATGNNLLVGGTGTNEINVVSEGNTTVYGGSSEADAADLVTTIGLTLSGDGETLVYSNGGNDIVSAALSDTASATIYGGGDDDQLTVTAASDDTTTVLYGQDGADEISYTGTGDVTIYGGNGEADATDDIDTLTLNLGAAGTAAVYGNGGNDVFAVTVDGAAALYGGLGDDDIQVNSGAGTVTVFGGASADTIDLSGFTGTSTIYGGSGAVDSVDGGDQITGGAGADLIYGNGGDDTIISGAGADTIFGGTGEDQITLGLGNKLIGDYSAADDVVTASNGTALTTSATVTDGDVVLTTSAQTITFDGAASQVVSVEFTGGTFVFGTSGADTITGGTGTNLLLGGAGNDSITAAGALDVVGGGAGNDTVNITGSAEVHYSVGAGTDTVNSFDVAADKVFFLDGTVTGAIQFAATDTTTGAAGTAFAANDTTSYAEVNTLQSATLSNSVIVLNNAVSGATASDVDGTGAGTASVNNVAVNNLLNAYVAVQDGANVSIYFDADWSDAAGRSQVITLTGVDVDDLAATNFGVYS